MPRNERNLSRRETSTDCGRDATAQMGPYPRGAYTYDWILDETDVGKTRLIGRNRASASRRFMDKIGMIAMEPGSLVMERKMLQGIKQRAERSM
jgi:hypothetical protein